MIDVQSRDCPKERTGDSGGYGGNGGGYGGSGGGYGGNGNFAGGDRTTTAGGRSAWGDRADNGYGSRNKAGEDGDKGGDNGWGSGGNSGGDRAGGDDDGWGAPAPGKSSTWTPDQEDRSAAVADADRQRPRPKRPMVAAEVEMGGVTLLWSLAPSPLLATVCALTPSHFRTLGGERSESYS